LFGTLQRRDGRFMVGCIETAAVTHHLRWVYTSSNIREEAEIGGQKQISTGVGSLLQMIVDFLSLIY
jgi:hypothetical protein